MSEIPYKEILRLARIDESIKMVENLFPNSRGFSKRYVLKTLELVKEHFQSSCQKVIKDG